MSDTPETDAFYGELHPEQGLLEHARSLERRLHEAHDMCDRYAEQLQAALREVENAQIKADEAWNETYQAALREVKELREALKFYAAEGSWQDDPAPDPAGTPIPWTAPIWGDEGQRARAALAEKGKP